MRTPTSLADRDAPLPVTNGYSATELARSFDPVGCMPAPPVFTAEFRAGGGTWLLPPAVLQRHQQEQWG